MGSPLASSQFRFASSLLQRSDAPDLRRFLVAQGDDGHMKKISLGTVFYNMCCLKRQMHRYLVPLTQFLGFADAGFDR